MFGKPIKYYYLYTMIKKIKFIKKINHDSMWIKCQFPSGGGFKYRVTRYDSTIEMSFGETQKEVNEMGEIFKRWVETEFTSYGDQFKKIEALCVKCNSGYDLIKLMKG